VPNGWYRAMIVESAVKDTKKRDGKYLQLDWQILDGEHKGRIIWDRLNIQNPNATAQKIGQERLSTICHTLGVLKLGNSAELHNKPCADPREGRAGQTKDDEPQNEVKGYKPIDGARPSRVPSPFSSSVSMLHLFWTLCTVVGFIALLELRAPHRAA
jgi:hypothetical protein